METDTAKLGKEILHDIARIPSRMPHGGLFEDKHANSSTPSLAATREKNSGSDAGMLANRQHDAPTGTRGLARPNPHVATNKTFELLSLDDCPRHPKSLFLRNW